VSLGNDPERVTSEEDHRAMQRVAAARQERHELSIDGAAPSVEAILRAHGCDADGYPTEEFDADRRISESAREALDDVSPAPDSVGSWGCVSHSELQELDDDRDEQGGDDGT
jgi:hypothetical protein